MADLKRLKASRTQYKASITRIESFVNDPDTQESWTNVEIIKAKRERLLTVFSGYERTQHDILAIDELDTEDVSVIEDKYITVLANLNRILKLRSSSEAVQASSSKSNLSLTNLPDIDLPIFDGRDFTKFKPFYDLFMAVIDSSESLPPIAKLCYLRKYLTDDALSVIINLPLEDLSYKVALQLLNNRYNNKIRLITNYVNILLDIQSVQKGTAASIRSFISQIQQQLFALKNMELPVDSWDMLLLPILSRKLDFITNRAYQLDRNSEKLPTVKEFLSYLEKRAIALEDSGDRSAEFSPKKFHKVSNVVTKNNKTCIYCTLSGHYLYECPKFKLSTDSERQQFVTAKQLCTMCLNDHKGKCKYNIKCRICKLAHNTLLHTSENLESDKAVSLYSSDFSKQVLLPTIKVKLFDKVGHVLYARALLDSGSQASFVTTSLVESLSLKAMAQNVNIMGIGLNSNKINKYVNITVYSTVHGSTKLNVKCLVVDAITSHLPQQKLDISNFDLPNGVSLSDDKFHVPGEISLLLGADVYFNILLGNIKLANGLILQNTIFGYVVGGKCTNASENSSCLISNCAAMTDSSQLEDIMKKFWLSEKVLESEMLTSNDSQNAERIFQESTVLKDNIFYVDIPLSRPIEELNIGDSFSMAYQRYISLEKKLQGDPDLFIQYKKFIDQYIELGHAKYVDIASYDMYNNNVHFLAHHAVHNEASKTTKLRVVFDGSMKTSNNISINDVMLNGPVVQSELFDILIRFRTYFFVLLSDAVKAFRCVYINEKHKCLQNILWRDNPKQKIGCLQLQTVTYGLKSSTFLTTRCMIELALRFGNKYPLAAHAMHYNTYVDDVISGCDSIEELQSLKLELVELLSLGNFKLHKWCSNVTSVLDDISNDQKYFEDIDLSKDNIIKTLGLKYNVNKDILTFACPPDVDFEQCNTKRKVLSFIGKMFDPLGLISPIIVVAKLFMQTLWSGNFSWDVILPEGLLQEWTKFMSELKNMGQLSVPRLVNINSYEKIEMIGFADASFRAFGCALYLRFIKCDGMIQTFLLCSKSRVAPLNKSHTIPQLELNSALLLAQLSHRVSKTLSSRFSHKVFLYSDSQIVLAWIASKGSKGNIYVNNRVKQILELTEHNQWFHVKGVDNPADIISRGSIPQKLRDNNLWWQGPEFLSDIEYVHSFEFKEIPIIMDIIKENEDIYCHLINVESSVVKLFDRFSSLSKLQSVLAYVYRFYFNCKNPTNKILERYLSPKELIFSLNKIVFFTQQKHFNAELKLISLGKPIKTGIANLNPFIDSEGILRVGGRLSNAKGLTYEKMHPMILPKSSHITTLLIQREHIRLLHGGAKLVLSSLSQKFWIVSATREVKKVVHGCVKCARLKANAAAQLMGSLPTERVTANRPFQHVGVDFCGPFHMKVSRIRKPLITKGYVALFVCLASKAIHIELVSNLSSEAFLACLQRFVSRRGLPSKIFCDNAKTFKGAANELRDLYELGKSKAHLDAVNKFASNNLVKFSFIPSYAPEFGGLWEAGVKSLKFHLKRIVGQISLTYEELNTVLIQVEGILNSRPLLPVSSDISDISYLTPGHFLIGTALTTYPEVDLTEIPVNRIKLWKICKKIKQDFWNAWKRDYLTMLQSRPKWRTDCLNIKEGDVVVVKNLNTMPLDWPLAKVVKTFPGKDGKVRVAEVKIGTKTYTRSILKLCPLPVNK